MRHFLDRALSGRWHAGPWIGAAVMSALLALATAAQELPGVIVAPVTEVEFPLTVEALGTARANESVDIRPKITETVTAIRFEEGQMVRAGQVLVELDSREASAAVAAAKANLVDSESKYERSRELFRSNLVPAAEVETAEARRDADRAALVAAEARLSNAFVRAPFAGRVGLRRISLGSLVAPSTVITTLDDTETIKLDFDVPETVISHMVTGLSVTARSAAWPDETFEGKVASIDTRVDPVSRTITARALLPNAGGLLRPGMFLTVEVLKKDVSTLVVPEQAIVPEQSRQYVFVVGDEGVVSKRQVRTGRRRPGQVEVVEGIQAGERVIAEGTQKARPGSRVQVIKEIIYAP